MSDRIETVETVTLSESKTIRTKEIIDNPTGRDVRGFISWIEVCKIARIEIIRPIVEIRDGSNHIVDYTQSESATIKIKLNGE